MGRLIGVFGAAGFGREVMVLVRRQLVESGGGDEVVFVERDTGPDVNAVPVMSEIEFLSSHRDRAFAVAIADGSVRKVLFERALASGAVPYEVRSPSAEVLDPVKLGEGAILCGHSSITSNTRVGIGFHLNISSYLAHDCVIGDFVTFGPNVLCAGNVIVENGAYIGGGSLIRQGKPGAPIIIGEGAVIGMGAVVTKNVAAGATVVGNPAKPIQRA